MANGDTATLPQPQQQDPNKKMQMLSMLSQLVPTLFGQGQQSPQGPTPGPQATPQRPGVQVPVKAPAQMNPATQVKFDPMSNVGSLPLPVAQPGPSGPQGNPGAAELVNKLDPRSASTFLGVQGVTNFIQSSMKKKDESQKAEAANAAQALMSALEGAKTTGDYSPAQHILENNEALFNKVYKGWLQKEEDSKKAQQEANKPKKEKKADPDVEGFEAGLAQYLGKGAAKQPGQPQPPSSLQGKTGAKYMMPQAAPQQAGAQQQTSAGLQAQRQDPSRDLPEQAMLRDPKIQQELAKNAVEYAKLDNERKKSEDELQKAQLEVNAAIQKSGFATQESQVNLQKAQTESVTAGIRRDTARLIGQIQLQKAKNGGQVPQSFKTRWDAINKVSDLLTKAVTEKRGITSEERNGLPALLGQAGLATIAKDIPGALAQWTGWNTPGDLLERIKPYKDTMEDQLSAKPSWLGSSSDSTDDSDVIQVSPEDMK